MLCAKVPLKLAEKTKRKLLLDRILNTEYNPVKESGFIFFPVKKKFSGFDFAEKQCIKRTQKITFKEGLGQKLAGKELEFLKTSMDNIGTIAILEIPNELAKREKVIAEEVLRANKNIKTVLKKGKHEGVFRTQKLTHLAGIKTKEAAYKENSVVMKLDVEKVYFSPRLSNERKRIMKLVKPDEKVLVMFSGCAPYVCVIAKNTGAKLVDGVEINPTGHEYALINLKLNKLKNARVFCGDVKEVVPELREAYDRIIMPLPKTADEYLDTALSASNKGATIHFYDFQNEDETEKSIDKIKKACDSAKRKFKILGIYKTGQHSPRAFRFCVDFKV